MFSRIIFAVTAAISCLVSATAAISLSPATWPAGELVKYTALLNQLGYTLNKAEGISANGQGIIAGTSSSLAMHVATDVLRQGGNSADAAVASSLAQIVIAGGSYVSFAGILGMVYYDASSAKEYSLNSVFAKPLNYDQMIKGSCNGKTVSAACMGSHVLVPGYFKGIESLCNKFCSLPLSTLLEPAIYFAEQGFSTSSLLAGILKYDSKVLDLFPESKSIFTNPATNQLYKQNENLKQLELASVLKQIAQDGNVDFMYKGKWASDFVTAVNSHGGNITMEDLSTYQPIWGEVISTTYRSNDVKISALNSPSTGGLAVIETINIIETLTLGGKYNESIGDFFSLVISTRWNDLIQVVDFFAPKLLKSMFPELDLSFSGRLKKETASEVSKILFNEDIATQINNRWSKFYKKCTLKPSNNCDYNIGESELPPKGHSDSISVIDKFGNAIAMVHSINSQTFGSGLIVQGVTIPDGTLANQGQLTSTSGGSMIQNPLEPVIVSYKDKPYFATATIGGSLHAYSILNLISILDYKMTPKQAVMLPKFQHTQFRSDGCFPLNITVYEGVSSGGFSEEIVAAAGDMKYSSRGLCLNSIGGPLAPTSTGDPGYGATAWQSPASSLQLSAVDNQLNGLSEGVKLSNDDLFTKSEK